ncbi:DUF2723 domain-containing protein [Dyadobacter sp. CY345]|uniref:glycosyltransferase family 117 protein n=1 Tax=Dyadobacter sp. CY345 TaxID=2909335 RepID=UPI001F31CF93|nr:DUF2723 domain-containing protein [Dyadobacter sp. CY345]MCF2444072.1 DUF2723 domain-containing protein [Dyadobacter sp. CY345]
MITFKRVNNLAGWLLFGVAFLTYRLTIEQTASFWDCGEFIACAFKLQVPHPPGAPFFLLIGRLFSMLAFGDVLKVAFWVNMVSVLCSAFTILFLFWTITLFVRKLIRKPDNALDNGDIILIVGAGVVGALAYTWSDSFWFSAVEAEVYAMSSFFTAIVIWAVFKWEQIEDPAEENRWLILIAYLTGISIGVHLLNLVTIPALALVYYFKKYPKPSLNGILSAFCSGLCILGLINSGIIPGLPTLAGKFEIFFVNTFGLPYKSGTLIFIVLFLGSLIWAIRFTHKREKVLLNTALLSLAFVLIGYASYLTVLVRSEFNTPINENDPSDILSFVSYLKREQYGSRPLLYGPSFTSKPISQKKETPVYKKKDGRYVIQDYRFDYNYEPGSSMIFPRLYSNQPGHPQLYQQMTGLVQDQKPTMGHNLSFLFSHQLGHMYWRYFLWNFAGRESDVEGAGTLLPWDITKTFPSSISQNRAHNNFFMLPLFLGLAGILALYLKNRKDLLVSGLLFFLTGVALVIYLNSPPVEPRERDYIYVGSFYIYCIWIGLGVVAVADGLRKLVGNTSRTAVLASVFCLVVPGIMLVKGWDNHDRSNRYHSVDFARNLLNSCAPNAILFTGGDNDTFPLWYVQEVEGFRTDVRVCVQTFLGADWYIKQLMRKINKSEALPFSLDTNSYAFGKNEYVPFYEIPSVKKGINLKEYLELIKQENKAIQVPLMSGDMASILPSSILFLPVNTNEIGKMNIVKKDFASLISDSMSWTIGNKDLYKSDLVMLDIIASNNWKRPIYFSSTMGSSNNLGLKEYMQLEGYAYRLLPVRVPGAEDGYVNSDLMYDNMMNKMAWREVDNKNTYYDNTYVGAPVATARIAFLRLTNQLLAENKKDKARKVLDRALAVMPDSSIPYDQISSNFIGPLFELGQNKKALDTARAMAVRADENLEFAKNNTASKSQDIHSDLYILQTIVRECRQAKQDTVATEYEAIFRKHLVAFNLYSEGSE